MELLRRNKLSPAELLSVDEHLRGCERCKTKLAQSPAVYFGFQAMEEALLGASRLEHFTYDELEAYVDGTATGADHEKFEGHLAGCPSCRSEAEQLKAFAVHGPSSPPTRAIADSRWYDGVRGFLSSRRLAVGAVGLVLILIGSVVLWRRTTSPLTDQLDEVAKNMNVDQQASPAPPEGEPNAVAPPQAGNDSGSLNSEGILASSLRDAGEVIGLDARGELTGYAGLPPAQRQKIERVLRSGDVAIPADLKDLTPPTGATMGPPTGSEDAFSLSSPVGRVSVTDRPKLSWEEVDGAESYVVDVFDADFNKVVTSGPVRGNSWVAKLARGKVYSWQVTARLEGRELKSPNRPGSEAKFKVISSGQAMEIESARGRRPTPHLLLGVLYAEAGLLDEALSEFRLLGKENPRSTLPMRLAEKVGARSRSKK